MDYNEQYYRNRDTREPWNPPETVNKSQEFSQEAPEFNASPMNTQVGGGHYKDLPIQPVEYIFHNNLGFIEGCIVKYITRYESKGGEADLDKVIHFAQLLKELRYGS